MKQRATSMRWVSILASLGVLAIAFALGGETETLGLDAHRDGIREAFRQVPDKLGRDGHWFLVRDVPIPTSQAKMLDLNAYVSKEYQLLGPSSPTRALVLLAHSADARKMAGHHPPNCYPASGWQMADAETIDSEILLTRSRILPVRVYTFRRGSPAVYRVVVNGFILPDGAGVARLEEAARVLGKASEARLGLMQFQVIFESADDVDEAMAMAADLIGTLPPAVLDSLSFGQMATAMNDRETHDD